MRVSLRSHPVIPFPPTTPTAVVLLSYWALRALAPSFVVCFAVSLIVASGAQQANPMLYGFLGMALLVTFATTIQAVRLTQRWKAQTSAEPPSIVSESPSAPGALEVPNESEIRSRAHRPPPPPPGWKG